MKGILLSILVVATAIAITTAIVYVFEFVSCTNVGKMLKTPSTYSFNKCYIMNADGDYIPEKVYLELLKYGE